MPRKRVSARYTSAIQKRRISVARGREQELSPAKTCEGVQVVSESCTLICKGEGEKKMTAAAAMIGLVAAIFRLAVDASGPMKTWWSTLVTIVHQHNR